MSRPSTVAKLRSKASKLKKHIPASLRSGKSSNFSENHSRRNLDEFQDRVDSQSIVEAANNVVGEDPNKHLLRVRTNRQHDRNLRPQDAHERGRRSSQSSRSSHSRRSSHSSRPVIRFLGQEQAARDPASIRLSPIEVHCKLIISLNNLHVQEREDIVVDYWKETAFKALSDLAITELAKGKVEPRKAFYLKVGRYRLVRHEPRETIFRGILEKEEDWNEHLPGRISEFRAQDRSGPLTLEIEWDHSKLDIVLQDGRTYAKTVSNVIEDKMQLNWQRRKYIPRKDLDEIMTRDTITKLVMEDESLYGAEMATLTHGKQLIIEDFTNDIYLWRARLLAWCIYNDLPLIYLYRLMLKGIGNAHLPLKEDHCPEPNDPDYRRQFGNAVPNSGGFAAHTFLKTANHETKHEFLSPGALVPIWFDKTDKKYVLGRGSFGEVYLVDIDPDHHSFSRVKDEMFALKEFFMSANTLTNVETESSTLSNLAKQPHLHITTHLASWSQADLCYMLFRRADCNLREYMKRRPPEWNKDILLGLFSQMKGLADGLRRIHYLGPSKLSPDNLNQKRKAEDHRTGESGFHHDLKPSNILVFIDKDTADLLFSISDFGSARIGKILSGSHEPSPFTQNLSPGDAAYGPPDALIYGETSRPYDLWSMGCIFLELLTWIADVPSHTVQGFADERMKEAPQPEGHQDQAFWYKNIKGEYQLKQCVEKQLQMLKTHCNVGVFPELVDLVRSLFDLNPKRRPKAHKLHNDLDAILYQLKEDLADENFYKERKPTEYRTLLAAPPSSVADSDDLRARSPSVDVHFVPARYGDTLSTEVRPARRATESSADLRMAQTHARSHARHFSSPEVDAESRRLTSLDTNARFASPSSTSVDEASTTPTIFRSEHWDEGRTREWIHTNENGGEEKFPQLSPQESVHGESAYADGPS